MGGITCPMRIFDKSCVQLNMSFIYSQGKSRIWRVELIIGVFRCHTCYKNIMTIFFTVQLRVSCYLQIGS